MDKETDVKPASSGISSEPLGIQKGGSDSDHLGLQLGPTFLKATKSPPLLQQEDEEKALEFSDLVLALTSAVVNIPLWKYNTHRQ